MEEKKYGRGLHPNRYQLPNKGGVPTRFAKILRKEAREIFVKRMMHKVAVLMKRFCGEEETKRVISLLDKGYIGIDNSEHFLSVRRPCTDPSIKIYNECTSVEQFLNKVFYAFKELKEEETYYVPVQEFFFVLSDIIANKLVKKGKDLKPKINSIIDLFITVSYQSPFSIQILDEHLLDIAEKTVGLDLSKYYLALKYFVERIYNLKTSKAGFCMPEIQLRYAIFNDVRYSQYSYLTDVLGLDYSHIKSVLKNVPDLAEESLELDTALEQLCCEAPYNNFFSVDSMKAELKTISKEETFKTFRTNNELSDHLNDMGWTRRWLSGQKIYPVFVNKELFKENFRKPVFSRFLIKGFGKSVEELEPLIDATVTMATVRVKNIRSNQPLFNEKPVFKVTITDVDELTQKYIEKLKKKAKKIKSKTGYEFLFEVQYCKEIAVKADLTKHTDYIRVISDIHADYNKGKGYAFAFGSDYVINCGDTGGNAAVAVSWNNGHIRRGCLVAGNHLGYSSAYPELDGIQNMEEWKNVTHYKNTKSQQMDYITKKISSRIRFLSNTTTELQGILIIGSTLFSDFELYGKEHREECMAYAKQCMNDFRHVTVYGPEGTYKKDENDKWKVVKKSMKKEGKVRPFTPIDHAYYFFYSLNKIKMLVEENPHKKIIIVTHFAPSPYCIDKKYKGDLLNAAFASNLNDFIISHPNIRLWCYGHCHNPADFILGSTRVVCQPFGYDNENNAKLPYKYGKRICIKDIKSIKKWTTILKEEIKKGKVKVYKS